MSVAQSTKISPLPRFKLWHSFSSPAARFRPRHLHLFCFMPHGLSIQVLYAAKWRLTMCIQRRWMLSCSICLPLVERSLAYSPVGHTCSSEPLYAILATSPAALFCVLSAPVSNVTRGNCHFDSVVFNYGIHYKMTVELYPCPFPCIRRLSWLEEFETTPGHGSGVLA